MRPMVTPAQRRTGFVTDDRFFLSRTEEGYGPLVGDDIAIETPEGKKRIRDLAVTSGLAERLVRFAPVPLERADVLRFHTEAYLAQLEEMSAGEGGSAGEETWFGPGGLDTAMLAAGGTYEAVRAVVTGEVDNAYALVRPSGHHAERDWGRGYCLLANATLAVMKARDELGVGRVALVDWDVHHGNGAEQAFYDDPDVLTVSLHQDRLYPRDSGMVEHTGSGAGEGTNINVPLPAGSGRGAYVDAFERVVEPALRRFGPDLLVVSCGFDAGGLDPLGRMCLSAKTFGELAGRMRLLAEELCGGRLAMTHEGGYSEMHAPFCGLRVLEELSGAFTGVADPFVHLDGSAAQELLGHQSDLVSAVAEAHHL